MRKNVIKAVLSLVVLIIFSSCDKKLDVLPDNRAELNNNEKIAKILVSAYPTNAYVMVAEISSDNVDNMGPTYTNYPRILEEIYEWQDVTETNNDGIDRIWGSCYTAIASANAALQAIEDLGSPNSLNGERGEALLARAYNHWILVNIFAHNYSKKYATTDLGITYMTKAETTLNPKYSRNTVAEVYDLIKKDIELGLPLINDGIYANSNVAKYHFNKAAAYTFASRVALFMEDWSQVVAYSTEALGNNPSLSLRDYERIADFTSKFGNATREYNSSSIKANFLIGTANSAMGKTFGNYSTNNRISHGGSIGKWETIFGPQVYGTATSPLAYRIKAFVYTSTTTNKVLFPHVAYLFEYSDPVAGIGNIKGVYTPITSEEALLNRAEAYIHMENYTAALVDLNLHVANNTLTYPSILSLTSINNWANGLNYFTPTVPTPKKKINPDFDYSAGTQENMIQAVLTLRRIQFLHTGMRWFDVKRYGIEITRRETANKVNDNGTFSYVVSHNTLKARDPRRAIQLPQDVINAGLTPNPR